MLATAFLCYCLAALAVSAHPTSLPTGRMIKVRSSATPATGYTALVAFGASYTDNAHARPEIYASSLRSYGFEGRYSNGPVAVEYMVKSGVSPSMAQSANARPQLLDYAYGGSQIDNSLTYGSSPDTKSQIALYLQNLAAGSAGIGSGRVLHYINTGINPVAQIWSTAVGAGRSSTAVAKAKAAVTANAKAVASQMRSINTNAAVASNVNGADYMIVGIPDLSQVPTFSYQVAGNSADLALLKQLAAQYNAEIKSFAIQFKKEVKTGKVVYYDLAAFLQALQASPQSYGITKGSQTCYNSSTGTTCSNGSDYLWFDSLHWVTTVHRLLATKLNAALKKAS